MAKVKQKSYPMFNNIKEILYNSVKYYENNTAFTIKKIKFHLFVKLELVYLLCKIYLISSSM